MVKLKILGIGTGRCGTGSLSDFINANGAVCGHEALYGCPGNIYPSHEYAKKMSKYFDCEVSWLSLPFLEKGLVKADKYVFLVRNPDRVIESFLKLEFFEEKNKQSPYVRFAFKHCKKLSYDSSPETNAILYVHEWMWRIKLALSNKNAFVFRIDRDFVSDLSKFLDMKSDRYPVSNKKKSLKRPKIYTYKSNENYNLIKELKNEYGYL